MFNNFDNYKIITIFAYMCAKKSSLFSVNTNFDKNAIEVDSSGRTIVKQLVLLDEVTGGKWEVKISNGNLIVEPSETDEKRNWKINNLLDNEI